MEKAEEFQDKSERRNIFKNLPKSGRSSALSEDLADLLALEFTNTFPSIQASNNYYCVSLDRTSPMVRNTSERVVIVGA